MTNLRNEGPIGVFDSSLGGLRVLDALARRLPLEDFVFLGDTARSPYGVRGKQTILNYCHACARALRDHRIKLLVLAGHTSSAVAQAPLSAELFMPVVGAIAPSLQAALKAGGKRIGVLTSAYLSRSHDYANALMQLSPSASLVVQNSQLLGAILDDGIWDGELPRLAVRQLLKPLLNTGVDVIVLGESPLPALRNVVRTELAALSGKELPLVDGTAGLVEAVAQLMLAKQLGTARSDPGKLRIVFSDMPADMRIVERYLGRDLRGITVTAVDL